MKTKREAAEFLGVSEKAIERYVASQKLSKHVEKKEGGGIITYYDEKELERLKQAMESKSNGTAPRQTDTTTALQRRSGAADLMQLLANAVGKQNNYPQVDIKDRDFLTIKEAAALKGLSVTHIEWAVKNNKLKASTIPHVRGRRIKRSDLDVYVKKI